MHPLPLRLMERVLEPAVAEFIRLTIVLTSLICIAWIVIAVAVLIGRMLIYVRDSGNADPGRVGRGPRLHGSAARPGLAVVPLNAGMSDRRPPDTEKT